jgi:hypothetical protein
MSSPAVTITVPAGRRIRVMCLASVGLRVAGRPGPVSDGPGPLRSLRLAAVTVLLVVGCHGVLEFRVASRRDRDQPERDAAGYYRD